MWLNLVVETVNMVDMRSRFMIISFAAVLVMGWAGCVTAKPSFRVHVSNFSEVSVRQLRVNLGTEVAHQQDQLDVNQAVTIPARRGAIPEDVVVHWTDQEANSWTQRVPLRNRLPAMFRGDVQLEIRAGGDLKVFIQASDDREESLMPWARPESWEGAPSIPGLSP